MRSLRSDTHYVLGPEGAGLSKPEGVHPGASTARDRKGERRMTSRYHVALSGSDSADGSHGQPFRTIGHAADLVHAGGTVVVHQGEYREWVRPRRCGLSLDPPVNVAF